MTQAVPVEVPENDFSGYQPVKGKNARRFAPRAVREYR